MRLFTSPLCLIIYFQAGTFLSFVIFSSVFGGVVFVTYGFATAIRWGTRDGGNYGICDALCKSQKATGFSIPILGLFGCIIGCAGCCCVTTSSGQVINRMLKLVRNFPEYLYFFSVAWIISLQFIVSTFNLSKSNE